MKNKTHTHRGKLLSSAVFMKRNNVDTWPTLDSGVAVEEHNKDGRHRTVYMAPGERSKMNMKQA